KASGKGDCPAMLPGPQGHAGGILDWGCGEDGTVRETGTTWTGKISVTPNPCSARSARCDTIGLLAEHRRQLLRPRHRLAERLVDPHEDAHSRLLFRRALLQRADQVAAQ